MVRMRCVWGRIVHRKAEGGTGRRCTDLQQMAEQKKSTTKLKQNCFSVRKQKNTRRSVVKVDFFSLQTLEIVQKCAILCFVRLCWIITIWSLTVEITVLLLVLQYRIVLSTSFTKRSGPNVKFSARVSTLFTFIHSLYFRVRKPLESVCCKWDWAVSDF